MLESRQKFDRRSPVQTARSPAPFLVVAVVGALTVWILWQAWPDDFSLGSILPPHVSEQSRRHKPANDVVGLISSDDYPADALDRNEQGTTGFRLDIDARGRVTGCTIVSSSGSASLDNATCRIMRTRARFTPALDAAGNPTTSTFSRSVAWRIADGPGF